MFTIRTHAEKDPERIAVVYENGETIETYGVEAKNPSVTHPGVFDVAVIGVRNDDLGKEVKAAVIPVLGTDPTPEFASLLIEFCRDQIAHSKFPRGVAFVTSLPRTDSGKMQKQKLRDRYWHGHAARLV